MPQYRVHFRNGGSVGPINAANEQEARRIAVREYASWAAVDPATGKTTGVRRVEHEGATSDEAMERMLREQHGGLGGTHTTHTAGRKPRNFRVTFRDGTSETVTADSLDEAWKKARRSGNRQISVGKQGRKVVADVERE